jgi:hypothetical protein
MAVRSTCKESHRPGTTLARRTFHDFGDQSEQRGVVARLRKRPSMHMMGNLKTVVVYPFRRAEVEQVHARDLGEPGNRRYSFGQGGDEHVVIESGSVDDCQAAYRQTHVPVRIFGLEEACIKRRQLLHNQRPPMLRFDVQSLSRSAQAPRGSQKSHDRESCGSAGLADADGHDAALGQWIRSWDIKSSFQRTWPLVSAVSAWRVWQEREQLFSRRMWFT